VRKISMALPRIFARSATGTVFHLRCASAAAFRVAAISDWVA
jgi:hypothetical protein